MVSVDVGIGHRHQPPAVLTEQSDVDVRTDRRVDDNRFGL
jgi:hypothetical protein